jgi:hypothetical protein
MGDNCLLYYYEEKRAPFIGEKIQSQLLYFRSNITTLKQENKIILNKKYFNTPPQVGA